MSEGLINPQDAIAALERFVVENDDLLQLEERIGRFNIFDALGIARTEIRHSNFLAWLLDPAESHGQGPLFLNAVLMDLLRQTPVKDRLFSPIKLDGSELRGVQVRREWNRIDLLITCDDPSFVIAIENKVDSGEHSNQLACYKKIVNETPELAKHKHRQFVYLTREGDEPSEDDWTIYSYADLHRVLLRVRNANASAVGDDVLAFLDHYLRLIGSRFMDDPEITQLCQRIYKQHRSAIDLILSQVGTRAYGIASELAAIVQSVETLEFYKQSKIGLQFGLRGWSSALPKLGTKRHHPERWLWFIMRVRPTYIGLILRFGRMTDLGARRLIYDALMDHTAEFGLRAKIKWGPQRQMDLFHPN